MCQQMYYSQVMQEVMQEPYEEETPFTAGEKSRETEIDLNLYFEKERETENVVDFIRTR